MNKSVYLAASKLSADELSTDRGAFFGSIIGTLDYVRALNKPKTLNAILHPEFKNLEYERIKMDEVIREFTHELTDEALASSLSYCNTKGEPFSKNFGHLIQHFFNHQTHHRGQVSTLLSQAGIDVGVTDLLVGIPNE
jgi:uncharacterized damage-inducible protein DinB